MGSCFGKTKPQKYLQIERASRMTKTAKNLDVTKTIYKVLSTKLHRTQALKEKELPEELRIVMTPPYSSFDMITDSVFLTGTGGMIRENIIGNRISCIINTTFEVPNYLIKGIETIRIPVDDDPEEELYIYFNDVSDKINEVVENKRKVVVHCVAGSSRSATFLMAYLMKYKRLSLKEAFLLTKQRRTVIEPKISFMNQLILYEKEILGKNSVQMTTVERGGIVVKVPNFYPKEFPDLVLKEAFDTKGKGMKKSTIMNELSERSVL